MDLTEATVLAAAPDPILVADEHGRVELLNAAAERMFGYASAEIVGGDMARLFPGTEMMRPAGGWRCFVPREHADGGSEAFEVPVRRANGEIFPAWLSVGVTRDGGRLRYVGVFRDLSAQKAAAARLRSLEARLAAVTRLALAGEVAAGMAHEINQPLSAAATYAQAARRLMRSGSPDLHVLEDVCEKIDEQARRAGDVVQRMRELIRRPKPQAVVLDINSVVAQVMNLIEADAGMENVPVSVEYTERLPTVRGDALQLQAVLLSLVRNSIEAMREGAAQRGRRILIGTALDERGRVCVTVADCGSGVAPALAERIFDPFVTSDRRRLGIGLSIGRSTIKAHDGGLSYESHPDGGSIFVMSLPPCDAGRRE